MFNILLPYLQRPSILNIYCNILAELAINISTFALGGLKTLEEDGPNTPLEASKTPKIAPSWFKMS